MKIFEHLVLSKIILIYFNKINASFTQQWRHCDVMLVLVLLQTVIEVVLLISAPNVHWRV